MNIIALLLCFGVDRYWPFSQQLRQYSWLEHFWEYLYRRVFSSKTWHPALIIAIAFVPVLLITGLLQLFFNSIFYGILGFLFNLGVLFYCLGTVNFRENLEGYFAAKERGDYQEAVVSLNSSYPCVTVIDDNDGLTKHMMQYLLIDTNQQIFSVIFWYLFLGAFGALFYRMTLQMKRYSQNINGSYGFLGESLMTLQSWFEWAPARLFALGCALAGNFVSAFGAFLRGFPESPRNNNTLVVECGLAALNSGSGSGASLDEQAVIDLIERAIVIALVSIALMTLGAWIN